MTYTLDKATATDVLGKLVGPTLDHIVVATATANSRGPFLLAVRRDGREYVTWAYEDRSDDQEGVILWMGHYFNIEHYGSAYLAFMEAARDLERRQK